jgi:two-component SAPR family response regulator
MTKINPTYDRVFIVDDDKVINIAHFQIIKATGVANEIRVFGNPLKAPMELSQELESSLKNILVLLDIDVEEINGLEFLDSLLPINPKNSLEREISGRKVLSLK